MRQRQVRLAVGIGMAVGAAVLVLALVVPGLGVRSGGESAEERARHVVMISLDTARADHFGFVGGRDVRTPCLDALAKESIAFADYMTVVPTTLASHTSLFTGSYPHNHGTPRNGFMVNRDNEMLPEILKAAGFHTAGFAAAFALHSRFDFAQGFDHYDEQFDMSGLEGVHQNQRRADAVTDAVFEYLDEAEDAERLFLFVHYFDPHQPYDPPAPFDTAYDSLGRSGLMLIDDFKKKHRMGRTVRERHARRYESQYAAEISYMDHHVGRLLDGLRGRGILEEALVVVTSDHGENLWDHEMKFDHGSTLYQTTMRAVCLFRLPHGRFGGTRVDQVTASIDVLPTVLQYLGIDATVEVDGEAVDLRSAAQTGGDRTRFGQATKPLEKVETDSLWTNMLKARCVRDGRYKFIQTPYRGTEELYDVVSDPGERHNLLSERSPKIDALAVRLRERLENWAASADPLPSVFERSKEQDTIDRLRSLGYIK
jgi:choline-sulfatase